MHFITADDFINNEKLRNEKIHSCVGFFTFLEDKPGNDEIMEKINSIITESDRHKDKDGNSLEAGINRDYFSIKDKIKEIMANEEGAKVMNAFIDKMLATMSDGGMKLPKGAMKMMGGFSIERIAKMLSDKIPAEVVLEINEQLQKIKK